MNIQKYVKGCLTTKLRLFLEGAVIWGQGRIFFSKRPRLLHVHHSIHLTKQGTAALQRHPPCNYTPRMRAAGPVLMVGLKRRRKNYWQRQRSAAFYNPFVSQDLDNSSARRKGFGWNYGRLVSFLGHLNTDDYVTVLSGSTQKFQERKFEDNRQEKRKARRKKKKKILLGEWT